MESKKAGKLICSEETDLIDFIKRVMEKSKGELPVHRLKIQLEPLPKPTKSIMGGLNHKQLSQFLIKHNKHFVVRFGVAYLVQNESSATAQYGRVYTDVCGQFETKRKIRLLEHDSFVFVTKQVANEKQFEVGDLVKCNVSKGANELIATHIRVITAQEIDLISIKSPNDEKTRQPGKKNRSRRKKKSVGSTNNDEIAVKTGIDYKNAENLVNVAGSVVKLTHQNGRLRFVDGNYVGEVLFVIDDYYEDEKKVLNLEWYLKVGDEVFFDAILEAGFRWKGLIVWKGLRPQIATIIDKKRILEEYLERNNPLISMDFRFNLDCDDVPVVTVGGKKASKKGNLVATSGTKPTGTKPKCERNLRELGTKTRDQGDLMKKTEVESVNDVKDVVCGDLYDLVNKKTVPGYSHWDLSASDEIEEVFKPLVEKSRVKSTDTYRDTVYGSMDDVESAGSRNDLASNASVVGGHLPVWNFLDEVDSEVQTGIGTQDVIVQPITSEVTKKSEDGDQIVGGDDSDCCKCVVL